MKKAIHRFINNVKGVAVVEFSLTIGLFLFVLFMILEACRIVVLGSYLDLSVTEAARFARKMPAGTKEYKEVFEKHIQPPDTFWAFISHGEKVQAQSVQYFKTVEELVNKTSTTRQNTSTGSAFAEYSFEYKYKPMFFITPEQAVQRLFKRKIVVLQEYEKD
ncbi:TadE/TadG family type IV pilus assembly protein [[Haemophilus] ducreyi]|nr:TadE family protein [[Haemophilus] ducreyi]AKO48262.1 Tight adherence protein E [[Haemophilus] ducreyi]AKO49652.1 Tight adherence protein E [[Haemophilus] ducreyi]